MTPDGRKSGRELPERARVVVIGGGIAGCSLTYHLTRLGWSDCLLVEKGELTSGSTWHAAGLCTQFTSDRSLMKLLARSMNLYEELNNNDGGGVGLRRVGSLRLANSGDRVDEFKARQGMARTLGIPFEIIGPSEIAKLFPLIDVGDLRAAAFLPTDGYIDSSLLTQALASAARREGAEIRTRTRVTAIIRSGDGWRVRTDHGDVECAVVVNAAGQWAPSVAALVGSRLPIIPLQHQYVITEELSEVSALTNELPVLRDSDSSYYVRQELNSLLVGPFERNPLPWAVDGLPEDFEGRLLPGNLDRIMDVMLTAARRVPVLHDAGLRTVINGPDGYTPDGRCLMGEMPGMPGFFVLAGFSIFGIVFGGGAGAYAAEWIIDSQPSDSLWELDVCRFGPYASTTGYTAARAAEIYEREYAVHYPNEEYVSMRPLKTDPLYDDLASRGAVFGERFGWERATWFAGGPPPAHPYSFRIPAWHGAVGEECRAVRESVGVINQTSFAKYQVSGPGARHFLDYLCANRLPSEPGAICLTQMLTDKGGIECDVTVSRLPGVEERFYVVSAAAAEQHDLAWIVRNLPEDGSVQVENVTNRFGVLTIAGPRSRELLSRVTHQDVSSKEFPFFRVREIEIDAVPVRAMRLSFVGELGYELHHPIDCSRRLLATLRDAGQDLGLRDFGYLALDSMRLEKGYRLWGTDITQADTPLEAGLSAFVDWNKDFRGRPALARQRDAGIQRQLLTLHTAADVGVVPSRFEPVLIGSEPVGYVAAGGFGHCISRTIALAYLAPELVASQGELAIDLLGEKISVDVTDQPLYDPENERLRG